MVEWFGYLIKNHANIDDLVLLIGGSTGRDGVGGSQFASDALEGEDRSAVQILIHLLKN